MTNADKGPTPLRFQPSVRGYTILALTALMALILALIENDRDLLGVLLLAAVGAAGVVMRWRAGPPLVLLGLAVLEWFHVINRPAFLGAEWEESLFMDVVLAAAVLAYAAAHYRLMAMVHTAFPRDPRRPPPAPRGRDGRRLPAPPDARTQRSAHLPGPWEMPLLAIAAAVWAVAVAGFWLIVSAAPPPAFLPIEPRSPEAARAAASWWHIWLLIFLVGLTTAVLAGAAAYLRWVCAPPEHHLLYLQDQAWRETRREQNRINRFLTWARLRAQRRKEKS
jgi:hypothetical protein